MSTTPRDLCPFEQTLSDFKLNMIPKDQHENTMSREQAHGIVDHVFVEQAASADPVLDEGVGLPQLQFPAHATPHSTFVKL